MQSEATLAKLHMELQMDHGGDLAKVAQVIGCRPESIIDFSTNISPYGLPQSVRSTALSSLYYLDQYPDPDLSTLEQKLAEHCGVDSRHILLGNGASELIFRLLIYMKLNQGEGEERRNRVLIPVPTFLEYEKAASAVGFDVIHPPLDRAKGFALPANFCQKIDERTQAVFLCQPNNPTGHVLPKETVEYVLNRCKDVGAYLILDECFLDLLPAERLAEVSLRDRLHCEKQLFILGSFTKTFGMPGIRLGYLLSGDLTVAKALGKLLPPWSISDLTRRTGLAALSDQAYLDRLRNWLPEENKWFREQLVALGAREVGGEANFVFFSLPGHPYFREELLLGEHPFLIRSCANYPGLSMTDYRVAVRLRQDNEALINAMGRILRQSEKLQSENDGEKCHTHDFSARTIDGHTKQAKSIMVLGTTSNAGKSFVAAGLCRLLTRWGYKVAPFKAQNMALNSAITPDGLEIGRAQAVQAEACGIKPTSDMNPILLKPTSQRGSQVIVNGEVWKHLSARDYYTHKVDLWPEVKKAYDRLAADFDIIVVEGAGSPAEINLRENDFVNAGLATQLDIPCILVGDIDRGGVFASLYGTVQLLESHEQDQIKALLINKFRGDISILEPGCRQIEILTGKPMLGCLPMTDVVIEDEDSLAEQLQGGSKPIVPFDGIDIAVIRLPRLSNFTDFNVFRHFPDMRVRYVSRARELGEPDLIILPGTKNTIEDLLWLRTCGLEAKVLQAVDRGVPLVGICGGYQMLGDRLSDPEGVEREPGTAVRGLGVLRAETIFASQKTRGLVEGKWGDQPITGYEIHMGQTRSMDSSQKALFTLADGRREGLISGNGRVYGTYLHGCFDAPGVVERVRKILVEKRTQLAQTAPQAKTLSIKELSDHESAQFDLVAFKEQQYDRLADELEAALDVDLLKKIIGIN